MADTLRRVEESVAENDEPDAPVNTATAEVEDLEAEDEAPTETENFAA